MTPAAAERPDLATRPGDECLRPRHRHLLPLQLDRPHPWRHTSVARFASQFFTLAEADLPYKFWLTVEGNIATIGRCNFGGKLSMEMTAHPKIDAKTEEVFAFRYGPVPPFLTYFRFNAAGKK